MPRLLFFTITLLLAACTLDNPGLPSWENEVTVALPADTYPMADLADNDSLLFSEAPDGPGMWIEIADSAADDERTRLSAADLSNGPTSERYRQNLGEIELGDDTPLRTPEVNLNTLLGTPFAPGDVLPVAPAVSVTLSEQDISFTNFRSIDINSAKLQLDFVNGLFLDIESISIDVYNRQAGDRIFIATVNLPGPIPAGARVSNAGDPVFLQDISVSNEFSLDYRLGLAARSAPLLLSQELLAQTLFVEATILDRRVSRAEAEIPPQVESRDDAASLAADDNRISYGEISKGGLTLNIDNHINLSGLVSVEFANLFRNDELLLIEQRVNAGAQVVKQIDLGGVIIRNPAAPQTPIEEYAYSVTFFSDNSDGIVSVSADDSITASIEIDSLYFATLSGELQETEVDIEAFVREDIADYGNVGEGIRLDDARLLLFVYNEIGLPINAELRILGEHQDGPGGPVTASREMVVNIPVAAGIDGMATLSTISLDANSSEPSIVDLLEILPTRLTISGSAAVSGRGSASVNQEVWYAYRLESPMRISIATPIAINSDAELITEDDIGAEGKDFLRDNIQSALLEVTVTNGLPVGVETSIHLSKSADDLFSDTISDSTQKLIISDLQVAAASVDGEGLVNQPRVETLTVALDSRYFQLLADTPLYSGVKTTLQASEGSVLLRPGDAVSNRGLVRIRYKVDNQ
jgi:hypothetical protein